MHPRGCQLCSSSKRSAGADGIWDMGSSEPSPERSPLTGDGVWAPHIQETARKLNSTLVPKTSSRGIDGFVSVSIMEGSERDFASRFRDRI